MVKLQRTKTGQYWVTVSKALVDAKGYQPQDVFDWQFNSKGNLELVRKNPK